MMNLRITKPGGEDLRQKYVGKKFRYNSKYGGTVENILCEDISICEIMNHKNGDLVIEKIEISIISDKRNVYDLNEVEFYEKVD
jgi:hypothetical protein